MKLKVKDGLIVWVHIINIDLFLYRFTDKTKLMIKKENILSKEMIVKP